MHEEIEWWIRVGRTLLIRGDRQRGFPYAHWDRCGVGPCRRRKREDQREKEADLMNHRRG